MESGQKCTRGSMIGDKKRYSCFDCGKSIIAEQGEEGTVPYIIKKCVNASCGGLMKDDFASRVDLGGSRPTHRLVRGKDSPTDKLIIQPITQKA